MAFAAFVLKCLLYRSVIHQFHLHCCAVTGMLMLCAFLQPPRNLSLHYVFYASCFRCVIKSLTSICPSTQPSTDAQDIASGVADMTMIVNVTNSGTRASDVVSLRFRLCAVCRGRLCAQM